MKHREDEVVRARHEAQAKGRAVVAIGSVLREMASMVRALDRYINAEEKRTQITDVKHRAYSTAAMAARVRSTNLKKSIVELTAKLRVAVTEHDSALSRLAALEKGQDAARSL